MESKTEMKKSMLDRYTNKLARDYPKIWATRFDIPVVSFCIFAPLFFLFLTLWHPLDSYALREKSYISYSVLGLFSLLTAIFWVFSKLNSLQLSFSPKLRFIPWGIESHLSTALIFSPVALTSLIVIPEIEMSSSKYNYISADLVWGFPVLLFGVSSFLSGISILSRRFGFQDCLLGTMISLCILAIYFFICVFLGNFFPLHLFGLSREPSIFLMMGVLYLALLVFTLILGTRSISKKLRYILFYPIFFLSTAGFYFLLSLSYLDNTRYIETIITILLIYLVSAVIIELIMKRVGYQPRPH